MALQVIFINAIRSVIGALFFGTACILQGCSNEVASESGYGTFPEPSPLPSPLPSDGDHDASKCSDDGRDCCQYHQTCDEGYVARPDPVVCQYTSNSECKSMWDGKYCYGCFKSGQREGGGQSPAPVPSPGPAPSGPLTVLALHGLTGHGSNWASLRSIPGVNICNPDGPYAQSGGRSWWAPPIGSGTSDDPNRVTEFAGYIAGYIDQHCGGSVDVMVGHSQGGYAITALLGSDWKDRQQFKQVRGVVMLSTGYVGYFHSAPANLKSLHMFDPSDHIVPQRTSQALASKFTSPMIIQHRCGHMQPTCPTVMNAIPTFLRSL